MRMMCAPPAMPACSAIQPASRPMTSMSMTRWWLSAVVWRRSMASDIGKLRAFRHNDKAVMATANFALSNGFADGLKRKGNFRDEDDVCSARDAGVQRNPACVASHDFNEHDAMVALRSSVEAVDGLRYREASRLPPQR